MNITFKNTLAVLAATAAVGGATKAGYEIGGGDSLETHNAKVFRCAESAGHAAVFSRTLSQDCLEALSEEKVEVYETVSVKDVVEAEADETPAIHPIRVYRLPSR